MNPFANDYIMQLVITILGEVFGYAIIQVIEDSFKE